MMMSEARRQGFGLEEGLLLSGTPDLRHPHYIEPGPEPEPEPEHGRKDIRQKSAEMSTGAETFEGICIGIGNEQNS